MENNSIQYVFEKYDTTSINSALFDKSIDCTYIICREDNIQPELKEYIPTSTIYFLFHKGNVTQSYLHIFRHAEEKKYYTILILYSDFIFDTSIKDPYVIRDIETFLIKNRNTQFIYSLGTIPIIQIPSLSYTYTKMNIYSLASYSNIYSKKLREKTLQYSIEEIGDWDKYLNSWGNIYIKYMYYRPLCINSINSNNVPNNIIKNIQFDKHNYRIFYILSQYICIFILLIVYIIVYYLFKNINI